ncbi:hypothetical protein J3F84DRAFT_363956 [Trichoderma pleuroticola]
MSDELRHVGSCHSRQSFSRARTHRPWKHVSDRKRSCNAAKQDEKTQNKFSVARRSQISGIKSHQHGAVSEVRLDSHQLPAADKLPSRGSRRVTGWFASWQPRVQANGTITKHSRAIHPLLVMISFFLIYQASRISASRLRRMQYCHTCMVAANR